MMTYDPTNWYWLASDGRVFASARQAVVTTTDAAYVAWTGGGNTATPWPKDSSGNQTPAALQWVFSNAGVSIFADLGAYAAAKRFAIETGGITVNGAQIATDRDSQAMVNGAYAYVQASGATSVSFKASSGFTTLDAATLKTIALAVGAHVQSCFAAEATIDAAITAGTITTTAGVDAAFGVAKIQ